MLAGMAAVLDVDLSAYPPAKRNVIRWLFQYGEFTLDAETLYIPERDQRLILYTAAPGTGAYEALATLKAVGV